MELIKFIDYEGQVHYLNKEFIISVRPFDGILDQIRKCKVEYGNGWMDCIYMSERVNEVVSIITTGYIKRGPVLNHDKI